MNSSLDEFVKILKVEDFILSDVYSDRSGYLKEETVHPCEAFKTVDDYEKPLTDLKKTINIQLFKRQTQIQKMETKSLKNLTFKLGKNQRNFKF